MQVKIYLHGHLKNKIGREYVEVEATTVYEAVKVLALRYQDELQAPLDIGRWKIRIKDYDTRESWFVPIFTDSIHIYPIFRTAKSGWATVAIGALLIVGAILLPGVGALGIGAMMTASTTVAGVTVSAASIMFSVGVGLCVGGLMNVLFPAPSMSTSQGIANNSKYLGAPGNTVRAGTRIPIGYGLFKVSGHFISYNISTTMVKIASKKGSDDPDRDHLVDYNSPFKPNGSQVENRVINVGDSIDQAEIVLGLCEGEIEGLEKGSSSFYVNDTPLKNVSGEYNFKDFTLEVLPGSGANEELKYFLGGSTRSTSVGIQLASGTTVVRQTQTGDLNFIELRLVISALFYSGKKAMRGSSVDIKIEYKALSEPKWHNISGSDAPITLQGRISGQTVQEFRIEVEPRKEPYQIRITKLSPDGDNTKSANAISWESFQEGFISNKEFPFTALNHIHLQYTNQLSSVPSLYGIYKLTKVRIPTNYDPITKTYNGEWDGTFKRAWSDNPAWCLYDFVMNDRYGMNAFSEVALDKWDCYEAAQWCDELVSDGKGGKEARYTCNLLQTEPTNGREFASYLASLFNAVLIEESTGYLRLRLEKDDPAVFLFTPENVSEVGFSYSFTNPETRYNDIKVSFTNPNTNWDPDTRRVYNQKDIDENGQVTYDFAAVGCIREGEALRRAYYKLICSLTEKTTVNFVTNRQAQCLANFDIILVADPVLGYSIPGRIKSLSEDRKTIYLRDSVYLEAGVPYKITFNTPKDLYETNIVGLEGSGNVKELKLDNPLPENLPELATFTIHGSEKTGTPKPFRVVSIVEVEGKPDNFAITAVELNRNKWEASDNMEFEGMGDFSGLPSMSDIPHILDASFFMTYNKATNQTELIITPILDQSYPYYSGGLVVYSREKGASLWIKRVVINNTTVVDHPAGTYEFKILPLSTTGITPTFDTAPIFTYNVEDVTDYPSNVKNLKVSRSINGVQLNWDPVNDIDLLGYEIREGRDWETGELIITDFMGTSTYIAINDNKTHYYMVCAKNYLGITSMIPAVVATSVFNPDDVPSFYATVSQDRVRFDWGQVEGVDIEYEIRQGNNWSTALKVAKVKGNNTTVLLPSISNVVYAIKAVSPAGLYSKNPRYVHPDMELFSNRNVILEIDNAAEGFPGITYGFEPLSYVEKALVMKQEVTRAEHYFPVELKKTTRARNWFETEAFSYGNRLTWNDLHYRYSSTEAHISWINSRELDSDGDIDVVILKYLGPDKYIGLYGFPYNGYTHDIKSKIYPEVETNITYQDSHITKGLLLQPDTHLKYNNLVIPEKFSTIFKLKVTKESEKELNLISLYGKDNYLKIYIHEGQLYLRSSDHKDIIIPCKYDDALDFLTIGVTQSEDKRTLYFYADYGNYEKYETIKATPVGGFNQYYVNRKIGEYNENVR